MSAPRPWRAIASALGIAVLLAFFEPVLRDALPPTTEWALVAGAPAMALLSVLALCAVSGPMRDVAPRAVVPLALVAVVIAAIYVLTPAVASTLWGATLDAESSPARIGLAVLVAAAVAGVAFLRRPRAR